MSVGIEGIPESVGTMTGQLGLKCDVLLSEDGKEWICDDLCFSLTGPSSWRQVSRHACDFRLIEVGRLTLKVNGNFFIRRIEKAN